MPVLAFFINESTILASKSTPDPYLHAHYAIICVSASESFRSGLNL
jgi:hypothetical protein